MGLGLGLVSGPGLGCLVFGHDLIPLWFVIVLFVIRTRPGDAPDASPILRRSAASRSASRWCSARRARKSEITVRSCRSSACSDSARATALTGACRGQQGLDGAHHVLAAILIGHLDTSCRKGGCGGMSARAFPAKNGVKGRRSRRSSEISSPQVTQTPYSPASIRPSAARGSAPFPPGRSGPGVPASRPLALGGQLFPVLGLVACQARRRSRAGVASRKARRSSSWARRTARSGHCGPPSSPLGAAKIRHRPDPPA